MKLQVANLVFFFCGFGMLFAQNPGGVGTPEVWFKTVPTTDNKNGSYKWQDYGMDTVCLYEGDTKKEVSTERSLMTTYNFNPALPFTNEVNRNISVKGSDLSQLTVIGVVGAKVAESGEEAFLYNVSGKQQEGRVLTKTKVIHSTQSGIETYTYSGMRLSGNNEYRTDRVKVLSYISALSPDHSIWQRRKSATVKVGGSFDMSTITDGSSFAESDLSETGFVPFYSPEFIIFGRALKASERMKVETYLALRYGITLQNSYISRSGVMLWNVADASNAKYKNRITGYGKDEKAGFCQMKSTTSYEEKFVDIDDTYHLGDSYNLSSEFNLLEVGYMNGSVIPDSSFVIFGDNGLETSPELDDENEYKMMRRKWMLSSILPEGESSLPMWNVSENMSMLVADSVYTCTLVKPDSVGAEIAYIESNSSLLGSDGYLSWIVDDKIGPLEVKFGDKVSEAASSVAYGYAISKEGKVNKIEKGTKTVASVDDLILKEGDKVEVVKDNNLIFLRHNGKHLNLCDIVVDTMQKISYYGSILFNESGLDSVCIEEFRGGGFDTYGHRVELSYNLTQDSVFRHYRNGNIYLMIDRSGNGDFTTDVDTVQMDELDEARSKAIFNYVNWDPKDVFTFAYTGTPMEETNISSDTIYDYELSLTDPTCDGYTVLRNGQIVVKLPDSENGFDYALTMQGGGALTDCMGTTKEDSLVVTNTLGQGVYNLYIAPSGNPEFDFSALSATSKAVTRTAFLSNQSSSVEWVVTDAVSSSKVAYMLSYYYDSSSDVTFDYGVKIEGNSLYSITKGIEGQTPLSEIRENDVILMKRSVDIIQIYVNGQSVGSVQFENQDIYYTCCVAVGASSNAVSQLKLGEYNYNGNTLPYGFDIYNPIFIVSDGMEVSVHGSISYNINFNVDCSETRSASAPGLSLYQDDDAQEKGIEAQLTLSQPQGVTFFLFSSNGLLLSEMYVPQSSSTNASVYLPVSQSGLYIVNTLTDNTREEYSGKIVIR